MARDMSVYRPRGNCSAIIVSSTALTRLDSVGSSLGAARDSGRSCWSPWPESDARRTALRRWTFERRPRSGDRQSADLLLRVLHLAHLHSFHCLQEACMNVSSDRLGWASSTNHGPNDTSSGHHPSRLETRQRIGSEKWLAIRRADASGAIVELSISRLSRNGTATSRRQRACIRRRDSTLVIFANACRSSAMTR